MHGTRVLSGSEMPLLHSSHICARDILNSTVAENNLRDLSTALRKCFGKSRQPLDCQWNSYCFGLGGHPGGGALLLRSRNRACDARLHLSMACRSPCICMAQCSPNPDPNPCCIQHCLIVLWLAFTLNTVIDKRNFIITAEVDCDQNSFIWIQTGYRRLYLFQSTLKTLCIIHTISLQWSILSFFLCCVSFLVLLNWMCVTSWFRSEIMYYSAFFTLPWVMSSAFFLIPIGY